MFKIRFFSFCWWRFFPHIFIFLNLFISFFYWLFLDCNHFHFCKISFLKLRKLYLERFLFLTSFLDLNKFFIKTNLKFWHACRLFKRLCFFLKKYIMKKKINLILYLLNSFEILQTLMIKWNTCLASIFNNKKIRLFKYFIKI